MCRDPKDAFVLKFLGDANRLTGEVRGGTAVAGGAEVEAPGVADGPAEIFARPRDLDWSPQGPGVSATVTRVLDRPGERRVIAAAASGEVLEFDVEPERMITAGETGFVTLRRAKVFALS